MEKDNIDIRPNLFRIQGKWSWQVKDVSFFLYGNYFMYFHNPRWLQSSVIWGKVEDFHRKPWMQGLWLRKPERMGSCFLWQMLSWWLWQNMVWKWAFSLLYFSICPFLTVLFAIWIPFRKGRWAHSTLSSLQYLFIHIQCRGYSHLVWTHVSRNSKTF